jgi:hypothetical protein
LAHDFRVFTLWSVDPDALDNNGRVYGEGDCSPHRSGEAKRERKRKRRDWGLNIPLNNSQ